MKGGSGTQLETASVENAPGGRKDGELRRPHVATTMDDYRTKEV